LKTVKKTLWELLWDYDPNGLIVVDRDMTATLVNPAFCRMFRVSPADIVDKEAGTVLGDMDDFRWVWKNNQVVKAQEKEYPEYDLFVRQVIFPIKDENIVACIMVDVTHEWHQKQELQKLKLETIEKVNEVVDNQMKVAQEIAGLLGETTAETKVSLLKLIRMVEQEQI
jgi:PAS domain-containing protein